MRQREAEVEKGTTVEAVVQEGQEASQSPCALVDLTAPDGGFGEWRDNFWAKRVKELREKAAEQLGEGKEEEKAKELV